MYIKTKNKTKKEHIKPTMRECSLYIAKYAIYYNEECKKQSNTNQTSPIKYRSRSTS